MKRFRSTKAYIKVKTGDGGQIQKHLYAWPMYLTKRRLFFSMKWEVAKCVSQQWPIRS
nr:MAG TPA: hypothetical protein [Caudoviricetes sp.]